MKVKELNKEERPREKALQHGIAALSNRELLALVLRSGTRSLSALELHGRFRKGEYAGADGTVGNQGGKGHFSFGCIRAGAQNCL